jgi:alpha-tubulin suppressor-like RCC1 family protein
MVPGTIVNVSGAGFTDAACAVNDQGAVYCEHYGTVGTNTPVVESGALQVSGMQEGQCVLTTTGIICGGKVTEPPVLPAGSPTEIACYYAGCCALNELGNMYCWGDTTAIGGMAGDSVRAVMLPSGKKAIGMGPGQDHICALLEGGQVQCWGADWNKQLGGLGDNKTTGVTLVASGATAVVGGQFHTCVAFEDKHVECVSGEQSDGAGLNMGVLTAVSGVTDAIALAAGKHYSCALESTGTIKCWGAIGGSAMPETPITITGPAAAACE